MQKLICILLLALGLVSCERQPASLAPPARPPASVAVAGVTTADVPVYLDCIGKTVPVQTVSIIPQVGGGIVSAPVAHGADVNKGDLLFEIDPRPFQAALDSAKAALQQNRAEMELAKVEFGRVAKLLPENAVSQLEYDQRRNTVEVAAARIALAEAAVQTAQLNLNYATIRSPLAGRTGVRLVDVGNVVKANDQPMLVIQQLDPIYAEFTTTENDLGTIRKFLAERGLDLQEAARDLPVQVDVPGNSARALSALGGTPAATAPATRSAMHIGRLVFLDNSVQSGSGTIKLRAELPNSDRYFWPGQFVNVRLILTTKRNAVLIPAQALQIGQQGPYVYVVKDQIAQIRPVRPGQRQGDLLVIDDGLAAGDTVITTGQMMVIPGKPVRITNAATQPATQPSK